MTSPENNPLPTPAIPAVPLVARSEQAPSSDQPFLSRVPIAPKLSDAETVGIGTDKPTSDELTIAKALQKLFGENKPDYQAEALAQKEDKPDNAPGGKRLTNDQLRIITHRNPAFLQQPSFIDALVKEKAAEQASGTDAKKPTHAASDAESLATWLAERIKTDEGRKKTQATFRSKSLLMPGNTNYPMVGFVDFAEADNGLAFVDSRGTEYLLKGDNSVQVQLKEGEAYSARHARNMMALSISSAIKYDADGKIKPIDVTLTRRGYTKIFTKVFSRVRTLSVLAAIEQADRAGALNAMRIFDGNKVGFFVKNATEITHIDASNHDAKTLAAFPNALELIEKFNNRHETAKPDANLKSNADKPVEAPTGADDNDKGERITSSVYNATRANKQQGPAQQRPK